MESFIFVVWILCNVSTTTYFAHPIELFTDILNGEFLLLYFISFFFICLGS